MSDAILIITPDPAESAALQTSLQADFTVYAADGGEDVLPLVLRHRPKVILMEMRLPSGSGLEVLKLLQQYPRTAHIPLMFMVDGTDALMKPNFLQAGAYDVLEKPLDLAELGLRIKNVMGRSSQEAHDLHPVTHLPTAPLIQAVQVAAKRPYHQITLQVEGLDTFKDLNGFISANEVLSFTATVLAEAINLIGTPEDFIGHGQEDEFVIITTTPRIQALMDYLSERLGEQLPQFHSFIERDQGYVELEDGTRRPLMSLQMELSQVS